MAVRAVPRLGVATSVFLAIGLAVSVHATRGPSSRGNHLRGVVALAAVSPDAVTRWAGTIDEMQRDGRLVVRRVQEDTMLPGRLHERFAQVYKGVPVFGSDVVRETENGVALALFGRLRANIDLDVQPALSEADALRIAGEAAHGTADRADLVVLPTSEEAYVLCYRTQIFTGSQLLVMFVDANDGDIVMRYDNLQAQAAVGVGTGVWGDSKKISTTAVSTGFVTEDRLRPPAILTYDLRGDRTRALSFLTGLLSLGSADLGAKSDNTWTDGAVVDGHVHAGWVYDYYWKRFGRHGLDNNNAPLVSLVHPVRRDTATPETASDDFYLNAFYYPPCRCIVYGDGVPSYVFGSEVKPFSAALDVAGHELTHAVTDASSGLIYRNESGALNEAFSDILGTAIEIYYQPSGSGPLKADYLMGEDLLMPIRSLSNPRQFGDPDHYSKRDGIGRLSDNGGVHTNGTIASHAFYLAIEGGANRTSGLSVRGVGAATRDQIEKIFYRAFVYHLPADATFYMARVATIQAARDLYGAGSAAEAAMTQAWDAVGVRTPGAAIATSFSPDPVPVSWSASLFGYLYAATFRASLSEFQGVGFTVTDYTLFLADSSGYLVDEVTGSGSDFAELFDDCGGKSVHIAANGHACGLLRVNLGYQRAGLLQFEFNGVDDNGNPGTFTSDILGLGVQSPVNGAWRPAAVAGSRLQGTFRQRESDRTRPRDLPRADRR